MSTPTEQIKEKLSIEEIVGEYVALEKAGKDFKGLCPFHNEKTPSFFVSPDKHVWHCFGCGKGGDVFTFVEEVEGMEFYDVLRLLAEKAGVEIANDNHRERGRRQLLLSILESATTFYEDRLEQHKSNSQVWQYLADRGVTREMARSFRIGLSPDDWGQLRDNLVQKDFQEHDIAEAGLIKQSQQSGNGGAPRFYDRFRGRIMFPIQDVHGSVIGFSGRILPWVAEREREQGREQGKYINSPATPLYDKSRAIYGLHHARHAMRKSDVAVFVEGQLDVVLAHKIGYRQTIAASGTAVTTEHFKTVQRYTNNVIVVFDMDEAGVVAARSALTEALRLEMNVKIAALPSGKDPADLALEDPAAFEEALANAKEGISFFLDRLLQQHDRSTARGKHAVLDALLPLMTDMASSMERSHWSSVIADRLGVSERSVSEDLDRAMRQRDEKRRRQHSSEQTSGGDAPRDARSRRQLLEEHICGIVAQYPDLLEAVENSILEIFTDKRIRGIVDVALREKPRTLTQLQSLLPHNDETYVAQCAFRIERRIPDRDVAQEEFRITVRDIQQAHIRDALRALGQRIRDAEAAGNHERVAELQSEFTQLSHTLSQLE